MINQSLTQAIGQLVAECEPGAIPGPIRTRATVSVLHNLVVGLAGRKREPVAHLMAARCWAHPPEATLLHSGARVSIEAAGFANAALMNARSQDDTHAASTSHPGSPAMAAALAVGEACGSTGAQTLTAIILGYEALCRIGRDFDDLMAARGFRPAALLAGFGAAAASARLLELSAAQTAHALGLVANLAGGLAQVWREGSAEAPLQLGFAVRNGIAAARLAQHGATAAQHALEGQAGFYRAYAGTGDEAVEARAGIGQDWQFDTVTVKAHPVCAILQGPAGALLALMTEHAIEAAAIDRIALRLGTFEAAYPGIDHPGPFASAVATKMSAQFSLALAALERRITPEGLDRVDNGRVLDLSRRVDVIIDAAIPPRHSRIDVHLAGGRTVSRAVTEPVGRPSFADVARFAQALAPEIGAPPAAIDRLAHAVATIDAAPTLGALMHAALACRSALAPTVARPSCTPRRRTGGGWV